MGALHQEQLVALVVGEVDQRIMVHQAEMVGILGEVMVPMRNKAEVEEALTIMAQINLVWQVGTQMMMALCKFSNLWADFESFF